MTNKTDLIKELEAEIDMLKNAGIIEVAVRNPSVSEYMNHWEARAEGAEAKLAAAVDGLRNIIGMLDDPTGHEHVRDMRGATLIARATLAELKGTD